MDHTEAVGTAEYAFTTLFQPEPEGGFTVTCPSLPGLVTYGETLAEARAMAAEAVGCYLESRQKDGLSPPESSIGRSCGSLSRFTTRTCRPARSAASSGRLG